MGLKHPRKGQTVMSSPFCAQISLDFHSPDAPPPVEPQEISRGAQRLLDFLRMKASPSGQSWWGQKRIAEILKYSIRTIKRWLAELVRAKLVNSIRRGSTSNLYNLRENPCANQAADGPSEGPECPHVSIELNLAEVKKQEQASFEFPEPPKPNTPEYQLLVPILRRRRHAIERADHPAAYEAAIIRGEWPKIYERIAHKPPAREEYVPWETRWASAL
jgi:hypothetical protein